MSPGAAGADTARSITPRCAGSTATSARDLIWLLGSPATYLDLVTLNWSTQRQHDWYRTSLLSHVLDG